MMTAEFMLSKRPVLRFTAALFFLLKLFSSHIYCILELTSFPMQEIYDRFGKISTVGSSYRNNTLTKCVGKGGS